MGTAVNGGGGRAARALRLLLLLVLALAAVEYMFGSILDASTTLRTYLYSPPNATDRNLNRVTNWPKGAMPTNTQTLAPEAQKQPNKTLHNITIPHVNETASLKTESPSFVHLETSTQLIAKIEESKTKTVKRSITVSRRKIRRNYTKSLCKGMSSHLGPITPNKTEMELEEVDIKYPEVYWGGRYSPPNCSSRHKVAIIVPYRDRQKHLVIFLNNMHPFLMKQQLEYGIYIVEQNGSHTFNKARLMNVGFRESMRFNAWQCFIFHDVDLLPLDGRNVYSCPQHPRHMSAAVDTMGYKLPYGWIFGGVTALTYEQFAKVNGFSNKYWGWGGEDDDMFIRLKQMKYNVTRRKMSIARYTMLSHKKSSPNPKRYKLLSQTSKDFQKDGLSTLQYEVIEVNKKHLFTHFLVNIEELSVGQ